MKEEKEQAFAKSFHLSFSFMVIVAFLGVIERTSPGTLSLMLPELLKAGLFLIGFFIAVIVLALVLTGFQVGFKNLFKEESDAS